MHLKSIPDFAALVGLHPKTVRAAIARGEVPVLAIGSTLRVDLDAFKRQARRRAAQRTKQAPRGAVRRQGEEACAV